MEYFHLHGLDTLTQLRRTVSIPGTVACRAFPRGGEIPTCRTAILRSLTGATRNPAGVHRRLRQASVEAAITAVTPRAHRVAEAVVRMEAVAVVAVAITEIEPSGGDDFASILGFSRRVDRDRLVV